MYFNTGVGCGTSNGNNISEGLQLCSHNYTSEMGKDGNGDEEAEMGRLVD